MTPDDIRRAALELTREIMAQSLAKGPYKEQALADSAWMLGIWLLANRLGVSIDAISQVRLRLASAARNGEDLNTTYQREFNNIKEQTA